MVAWLLAVGVGVVAVTAVQVAAYYYLVRDEPTSAVDAETVPASDPDRGRTTSTDAECGRTEPRRCSECGAPNDADPVFTFCRYCGAQL